MRIARSLLRQVSARAAAAPDIEVCGLLLGSRTASGWAITAAPAVANVSPRPADRFELDPAALFAALAAERVGGAAVLGCYHSHPRGRAQPSPRDGQAAEPGSLWLIVGEREARLWLARAGGGFAAVPLLPG